MKTAIALITAALTATSAHAWGDREQGALAGIIGTLILTQIQRDSERHERHQPQVIVRERPAPVIVYRQPHPAVIIQDTPQIMCPQGTAEFYIQRFDRHGRPFYLFDGCR